MSYRALSRMSVALGILAPFVMSGCATLSGDDATAKANDTAAIAAAVASASHDDAPGNNRADAPGAARPGVAAAAAAAAAQQSAKPFADVVKEAKETKGLLNIWQKDDKVWLELAPDQFDKPYFFKSAINQGIGENRIFGGAMTYPIGVAQIVVFHKHGNAVKLIAKNVKYTAKPGTPEAYAVAAGFSDSLLAVAPISSQPSQDRKSVLIDANALLLSDIPAGAAMLDQTYHQSYGFDARNSSIGTIRGEPDNITLEVSAHYAVGRLAVPMPGRGPGPQPSQPITLPDPRSMFIGYHYTFAKLPDEPMRPRPADERDRKSTRLNSSH